MKSGGGGSRGRGRKSKKGNSGGRIGGKSSSVDGNKSLLKELPRPKRPRSCNPSCCSGPHIVSTRGQSSTLVTPRLRAPAGEASPRALTLGGAVGSSLQLFPVAAHPSEQLTL